MDEARKWPGTPPDEVQNLGWIFTAFSGAQTVCPTSSGCLYGRREFLEQMPP